MRIKEAFIIFFLFCLTFLSSAFNKAYAASVTNYYGSIPPGAVKVADSLCSGGLSQCWNSWAPQQTDCPSASSPQPCDSDISSSWSKYEFSGCYTNPKDDADYLNKLTSTDRTCSTGDKYDSSNPPIMKAGLCNATASVCNIGGQYKTCCNGTTLVNASIITASPPNDFLAPPEAGCGGYTTVRCGASGEPACGQPACNTLGSLPTTTPGATATPVSATSTPVSLGTVPPPLLEVGLQPYTTSCSYNFDGRPNSITTAPAKSGDTIPLALCFKNANNLNPPNSNADISNINLTWNIPPGLTPLGIVKKPDGSTDPGCSVSGQTVTCPSFYSSPGMKSDGSIDGRVIGVMVNTGVTGTITIPRQSAAINWNNNPQYPTSGRNPGNEWGRNLTCNDFANCSLGTQGYNQDYTFSSNTVNIPIGICPGPPTNLLPQNNNTLACAQTATLSWDAIPNAEWYDIRVDDGNSAVNSATGPINNNCGAGVTHDICINRWTKEQANCATGTRCSMSINVSPNKNYSWWMDSSGGTCTPSSSTSESFNTSCLTPTPTVTPTPNPACATTDCTKCATIKICGTKDAYDTCTDNLNQSGFATCTNGATTYRCYASLNPKCESSSVPISCPASCFGSTPTPTPTPTPTTPPAPQGCSPISPPNNAPTVTKRSDGHTVDITYTDSSDIRADVLRSSILGFVPGGGGEQIGAQFGNVGVSFDNNFSYNNPQEIYYYQAAALSGSKVAYSNTQGLVTEKGYNWDCRNWGNQSLPRITNHLTQIGNTATTTTFKLSYTCSPPYGGWGVPDCSFPPYLQLTGSSGKPGYILSSAYIPGTKTGRCTSSTSSGYCYETSWEQNYTVDLPPNTQDTYTINGYQNNLCSWQSQIGTATVTLSTLPGAAPAPAAPSLSALPLHNGDGAPYVKLSWPEIQPGEQVKVYRSKNRWQADRTICNNFFCRSSDQNGGWVWRATDDLQNLSPGTYYYGMDIDLYNVIGSNCNNGERFVKSSQAGVNWAGFAVSGNVFWDKNRDMIKCAKDNPNSCSDEPLFKDVEWRVTARDQATDKIADEYTCKPDDPTCTGTYTLHLGKGKYDIIFTVPNGYASTGYPPSNRVNPKGNPIFTPSYEVDVNLPCLANPIIPNSNDVSSPCSSSSGNINGVDFGILSFPWFQGTGGDIRLDTGIDNQMPAVTGTPPNYMSLWGNGQTPGVIFNGNNSLGIKTAFGSGLASSTGWVVAGTGGKFKPANTNIIRTSYDYMVQTARQNGITPVDLSTICSNLTNCQLPSNLPNGVYISYYTTKLVSGNGRPYVFPAGRNYVFLINGDLLINEEILVPNGSTATFSVSGSINIDKSVGANTISTPCTLPLQQSYTSTGCQVEGFYSADDNIIIDGNNNDCTLGADKRLNVAGALVANAKLSPADLALVSASSFQQKRSLCLQNPTSPSFTILERPDLILNAPEFIKSPNYIWEEIAP